MTQRIERRFLMLSAAAVAALTACATTEDAEPKGECQQASDCAAFGAGYVCDGATCRPPPMTQHDASTTVPDAGNGGADAASMVDAAAASDGGSAVTCGQNVCTAGQVCCPGCSPGLGTCGESCVGVTCPPDAGQIPCGTATCNTGERCCDHCTGSCVSELSGQNCPDDNEPRRPCGTCGVSAESCLVAPCCDGFTCCSGTPIPDGQAHCYVGPGGCPVSDRNVKDGFSSVSPDAVLDSVLSLPITRWHYKFEQGVEHIGPMAQDFAAEFGVGADDKHIFQVDADGVAFAAIQALARRLEAMEQAQRALEQDNVRLRREVEALRAQQAR